MAPRGIETRAPRPPAAMQRPRTPRTLGVEGAERCRFSEPKPVRARLRGLQIARGLLASLSHDVVADLLAFHEGAHAGALDCTDVHEHILAAVARRDKSKPFLRIKELHGTCGHVASLHCVCVNPI